MKALIPHIRRLRHTSVSIHPMHGQDRTLPVFSADAALFLGILSEGIRLVDPFPICARCDVPVRINHGLEIHEL